MNNKTLINIARGALSSPFAKCTESQQHMFKCMYSKNMDLSVNEVVDLMDQSKLYWAISQLERTLANLKLCELVPVEVSM